MRYPKDSLVFISILFFGLGTGFDAAAATTKAKRKPKKNTTAVIVETAAPEPPPPMSPATNAPISHEMAQEPLTHELRVYQSKLNSMIGGTVLGGQGASFTLGAQYGVPLKDKNSIYVGPEFSLSYFKPGYLFLTMACVWYEFRPFGKSHLNLNLGVSAGGAFSDLNTLASANVAVFVEMAFNQEISDLATLRFLIRPGYVGGYFAILTAGSVGFRFQ